jgi:hypothetical protein
MVTTHRAEANTQELKLIGVKTRVSLLMRPEHSRTATTKKKVTRKL